MSDFPSYGGSDEENAEIKRVNAELEADPDNFELWEKLVRACEALEGGLNRNSSPQSLATLRDAYDRFLIKFPLLFGYWKKYADLEFNISGPESAEMVYERGCASITNSVDLWTEYCSFKMETTHNPELVRELFERAAGFVGLDFLAHPFWDKYLEYEERQEAHDKIFAILGRVIHIPMHQFARYFERHRGLALTKPLSDLASVEELARHRAAVEAEDMQAAAYGQPPVQRNEADMERAIRTKIDAELYQVFTRTNSETQKRWTFEEVIKRPYFHVTELDHGQISNWRKYLDFEEEEGAHDRIVCLYERCLVTCALYEEFWFRYARWMLSQKGKSEEVRNIYLRATTLFVPISRPGIRLQFAYFEESHGRVHFARDIHAAVLMKLPDSVETIVSWANLQRRQYGLESAIEIFKAQIDSPDVDIFTKAAIVTEWAFLLARVKGSIDEARSVFSRNVQWYADSLHFWRKWLEFELDQPTNAEVEGKHHERIKHVFDQLQRISRISTTAKKQLGQTYLNYLQSRGGKDAMTEFLEIDRDLFGPASVSVFTKLNTASKENGAPLAGLDDATRQKAESRFCSYYELYSEPDPNATGPASFH